MHRAEHEAPMPPLALETYRVLLPPIAGLSLTALAVNLAVRQAHATSGVSTFDSWSMLGAGVVIGALFISTLLIKRFPKRAISLSVFLSIHVAGLSALALLAGDMAPVLPPAAELLLQILACVGATLVELYWLRKLRGTSAQAVVLVAFCALGASELATFLLSFVGEAARHAVCAVAMFSQFLTARRSRALGVASDSFPAVSENYFGTDGDRFSNRGFLASAALGIWCISIPIGMGRGFSTGQAMHLDVTARGVVLVGVLLVCAMWTRFALASRMRALTTSIWVAMELLLGLAAVMFAVFPVDPSIGAAFAMAAALVLQAFVWYLTIAFISFGWRDPYYYAAAAWLGMNVLTVAGMRLDALLSSLVPSNASAIIAVMSLFVLIGAQVVFTQLLAAPTQRVEDERERRAPVTEDDVRRIPLMGVMALSPASELPMASKTPDVHIATAVMKMGQRFGLTGREVEVLTLYALGHTQARVSEELQLSQNTVHTHIKRVYDKTDLHSRQEILDYIAEYGG